MKQLFADPEALKQKALIHNTYPKYLGKTADDWCEVESELRSEPFTTCKGKEMYYYIYFDTSNNLILGGRFK